MPSKQSRNCTRSAVGTWTGRPCGGASSASSRGLAPRRRRFRKLSERAVTDDGELGMGADAVAQSLAVPPLLLAGRADRSRRTVGRRNRPCTEDRELTMASFPTCQNCGGSGAVPIMGRGDGVCPDCDGGLRPPVAFRRIDPPTFPPPVIKEWVTHGGVSLDALRAELKAWLDYWTWKESN